VPNGNMAPWHERRAARASDIDISDSMSILARARGPPIHSLDNALEGSGWGAAPLKSGSPSTKNRKI